MEIPTIDRSIERIRGWLLQSEASNTEHAAVAGVDEKVIRQARQPNWNPRAETVRRLEALVPADWQPEDAEPAPGKSRKRAA